jgi:hypothetical protein
MQINLSKIPMKEIFKYSGWFLLFVVLWFKGCSANEKSSVITEIVVPKIEAKFESKKPVHEPVLKLSNSTTLKEKATSKENLQVEKLIAENEKLKEDFAKASDSIKQLKFNKAIQLNSFSANFEDENLTLNINGIVQGEVKELTPNYTIKERKAETQVKSKETAFRLLGGLEVGNTVTLDNFGMKANLMFQNRKGNIISGSFDTNQTIWVGYNWSIFDVKK